jgi:large subunit ribosomal protein L21e
MVKSSKGTLHGARRKMKKGLRQKFKPETFRQAFKPGDKVIIVIDPSSKNNAPNPIFMGRAGTVKSVRGRAFAVELRIGGKKKEIQAAAEHLKRM